MDSQNKIDWYKKNKRRFRAYNGKKYKINFNKKPAKKIVFKFSGTLASTAPTLVEPPPTLSLIPYLTPVKDQGEKGDCVAFAVACTKEYQNRVVYGQLETLSAWFIYLNANTDDPKSCDVGLDITQGFDVLKNIGVATDAEFKTPAICPTNMPYKIPQNAITNAAKYKIHNYHAISTIKDLKIALANYGPCPVGLPVYNTSSTFWKQNSNNLLQGGHCVSVVGYTEDSFIIRNSWGEGWGNKGYSYWPFTEWGIQLQLYSANNLYGSTIAPSITNPILVNPNAPPITATSIPPGLLTTDSNTSTPSTVSDVKTPTITKPSLSTGAIIGIVYGCIILIIIIIFVYLYFMKK
jgi:C1A family cysteine protease